MEGSFSPQGHKHSPQSHGRKAVQKDLWVVVNEGRLADADLALAQLKKHGGNINSRNAFGLTLLHIATWRNRIPVVRRLLAAGADPDARDGESGWSSLHRALHFGHFAVASVLLQSGASITIEDSKLRTPIDLLSGPLSLKLGKDLASVNTEIFSWGSGTNYQLGTGNAHIQKLPCKVDALHGSFIKLISASKFHSVAVTGRGELYTWGFGRGGRLGHPEFDIHRFQANPKESHLVAVKRILRYLKGTDDLCLLYPSSDVFDLKGFADADYAGDLVNRKSTSGMVQFVGHSLVSWSSKKQNTVALSTAEAEYVAAAACCSQLLWIKQQLRDFGLIYNCVPIYCDNTSAICISKDPVHHSRVKHIHIRHHFLKDNVEKGLIKMEFCQTENQIADILTKPLNRERFEKMRLELGLIKLN